MVSPTDHEIGQRAHELWKLAGSPANREQEFWFEAERELQNRDPLISSDEKSGTLLEYQARKSTDRDDPYIQVMIRFEAGATRYCWFNISLFAAKAGCLAPVGSSMRYPG